MTIPSSIIIHTAFDASAWIQDPQYVNQLWLLADGDIFSLQDGNLPAASESHCASKILANETSEASLSHDHAYATRVHRQDDRFRLSPVRSRVVLHAIYRPLNTFNSTKELCMALRDAVTAYGEGFNATKTVHGDISADSVMIGSMGRGVLIDWDFPNIPETHPMGASKRTQRMGTWRFASGQHLLNPNKHHYLSDDLESFLHVLTFHLLRYRETDLCALEYNFKNLFDNHELIHRTGQIRGGNGKRSFFIGSLLSEDEWRTTLASPCVDLVQALRLLFRPLYGNSKSKAEVAAASTKLESASAMLTLFDEMLGAEGWPDDDRAALQVFKPTVVTRSVVTHYYNPRPADLPMGIKWWSG